MNLKIGILNFSTNLILLFHLLLKFTYQNQNGKVSILKKTRNFLQVFSFKVLVLKKLFQNRPNRSSGAIALIRILERSVKLLIVR